MPMILKTDTLAAKIVAQSDLKAERLISVLRMALAAMLFGGVSYIMSQAEQFDLSGRMVELQFLRLGAMAYFVLGAVNYYLSNVARFRPWMSWVFNLAEVMIVSLQLYIDVSDPLTPSLLALASPVLLVVALVICVQALRSQVYLHLATSAVLLLACAVVVFHDPQIGRPLSGAAVSELQAVYSLPPNVMRLVMLLAMAALIGTVVYRSRRLVERVGQETETAENRKRFIPNEISNAMSDIDLEALRSGQERELAVLFVDIRGFTHLSENMSARETAELLSDFRKLVTDGTLHNNGIVDKFIGDGALLIFGMHSDVVQASRDGLGSAREIEQSVQRWNQMRVAKGSSAIGLAMGLHAGPAVIGAIGDQRRLEFTAIGTTVNLASRLEAVAKEHDCTLVVSKGVLDMVDAQDEAFHSLGTMELRGSSEPIEVMAL